jgi:hypothetical protein
MTTPHFPVIAATQYFTGMCAQCMATAAAAVGGAAGLRQWLVARGFGWLTPRRVKALTAVLVVAAVAAAGTMSGSGA